MWRVEQADCIEAMREMDEASVDAIVTDPPYGLEFMGKEWDRLGLSEGDKGATDIGGRAVTVAHSLAEPGHPGRRTPQLDAVNAGNSRQGGRQRAGKDYQKRQARDMRAAQEWHQAWATEALRVLKPGGHLLAFGGTRTYHRLACAVEDAGFEIRDSLIWLYGSGFPKSLDVGKALDKRGGQPHLAAEIALAIKAAREKRGWTTGQADRHFCGGTTNWTWYEGRKGVCRPPTTEDFARIASEWTELVPLAEKVATVERDVLGKSDELLGRKSGIGNATAGHYTVGGTKAEGYDLTAPATPEAQKWNGWGTALKPSHEPVVVARKPLIGTVAQNVTEHGTGALNVDGCRVESDGEHKRPFQPTNNGRNIYGEQSGFDPTNAEGRWPANVVLSHLPDSDEDPGCCEQPDGSWLCAPGCPIAELDEQSGEKMHGAGAARDAIRKADQPGMFGLAGGDGHRFGDSGGASRFFKTVTQSEEEICAGLDDARNAESEVGDGPDSAISAGGNSLDDAPTTTRFRYCAKASRAERNAGLDGFELKPRRGDAKNSTPRSEQIYEAKGALGGPRANHHPTVKPIDLMRWLCRLVTPPGGRVCDPFAGSGTTGIACVLEDFDFIGIEREAEYAEIARARIDHWAKQPKQLTLNP